MKRILLAASVLAVSTAASAESYVQASYGKARTHEGGIAYEGNDWTIKTRTDLGSGVFAMGTYSDTTLSPVHDAAFLRDQEITAYVLGLGFAIVSSKESEVAAV